MKSISITKNILLNIIKNIVDIIIPLITTPYCARILGADGIGIRSFISSYMEYFLLVASFGIPSYGICCISRYREIPKKYTEIFFELKFLSFCLTATCLVFWGICSFHAKENSLYFFSLIPSLLAVVFDVSWFFTGQERFEYVVGCNIVFKILYVFFLFIFVNEKSDLALQMFLNSTLFYGLLPNIVMCFFLSKFLIRVKLQKLNIIYHFKKCIPYFAPTLAVSVYHILDKILLHIIVHDNFQNGYYDQAVQIINILKILVYSSTSVLIPRMVFLFSKGKKEYAILILQRTIGVITMISVGLIFGIFSEGNLLVRLFLGNEFLEVTNILNILSFLLFIVGLSSCLSSMYFMAIDKMSIILKAISTGSILNFVLNLFFIRKYGAKGAAFATVIVELLILIIFIKKTNGIFSIRFILFTVWKKFLAALFMTVVLLILDCFFCQISWLCFFLKVFIGIIIYAFVLSILKDNSYLYIKKNFLKKIMGVIKR